MIGSLLWHKAKGSHFFYFKKTGHLYKPIPPLQPNLPLIDRSQISEISLLLVWISWKIHAIAHLEHMWKQSCCTITWSHSSLSMIYVLDFHAHTHTYKITRPSNSSRNSLKIEIFFFLTTLKITLFYTDYTFSF